MHTSSLWVLCVRVSCVCRLYVHFQFSQSLSYAIYFILCFATLNLQDALHHHHKYYFALFLEVSFIRPFFRLSSAKERKKWQIKKINVVYVCVRKRKCLLWDDFKKFASIRIFGCLLFRKWLHMFYDVWSGPIG